jgi:hypothetical protein
MTQLKQGQHYDPQNTQTIKDLSALLGALKKHLQEEGCNHTLREILEEALK